MLDPQLPACTQMKLDFSRKPPDAWAVCVALYMLTVPTHTSAVKPECCIRFMLPQKVLFICSSKTTLLSNRIATLTKMQYRFCMKITEEILSFTPRLLEQTVGTAGFNRLQDNEVRCMFALLSSSKNFEYAVNFHSLCASGSFQKSS